jgi:hypothetical protein
MTKEEFKNILWGQQTKEQAQVGSNIVKEFYNGTKTLDQMTPVELALFMRHDYIVDHLSKEDLDKLYRAKFPFLNT